MDKFDYKVTMIVPIYNVENYLRNCLDSLVAQTIAPKDFEILLIDDGSPDHSIDIMREYAEKHSNMKILRKENEGPSSTRNYGIKHAKGKYIMYIDADDTLSPETVKEVTDFFDRHYDEVDVVTYKEIPIINGQEGSPHFRYKTLITSGVYDLTQENNYFISQTRINICVKNELENNILFDLDLEFIHEDQKYCIELIRKKMKIGFCNKGMYYYLHQPDSIVRTFFYAYYIFEKTMKFWEDVFAYYEDGEIPFYIQAMYLNDVNWKTCCDILLPYHYEATKFQEATSRILSLLNKVNDEIILRHPNVDNFHRQYYIGLKENNDIKLYTGPNYISITNHDSVIFSCQKIEIVLLQFKVKNNKIQFMGFVKSAAFNFLKQPKIYLIKNHQLENAEELDTQLSSWSHYKTKTLTNKFWLFSMDLDMNGLESFELSVSIEGKLYDTYYYFMPSVYFNHGEKRYIYYKESRAFEYNAGVFYIKEINPAEFKQNMRQIRRRYLIHEPKLWALRNLCLLNIKRHDNVWLYYDCKGVKRDNGYYQFVHDFDKKDGVRRYYVINEDDFQQKKREFPKKYRKYMVKFGSRFHKYLFLKARKVITAFIEHGNYVPFPPERLPRVIEVSNQPDIIYLQHGVLHAHVPWKYSLDRLVIDKEVISTYYEKENLINNYRFRENALIPCGMPRYDHIDVNQKSVNRILFAPSWRKYLVGMVDGEWVTTEDKFSASKYFKESSSFLNSKKLETLLEKYDYYLDFKLHPILERYKHLYHITNKRVTMAESIISETEYSIFMTDFSSFVFDFVYLERPIIYFLPDMDMFRAGMNDYREIDIPFEDGFGDLVLNAEEAVTAIEKIFNNDGKPEQKYAVKMKDFFFYKDNHQTDRLYEALIKDEAE